MPGGSTGRSTLTCNVQVSDRRTGIHLASARAAGLILTSERTSLLAGECFCQEPWGVVLAHGPVP